MHLQEPTRRGQGKQARESLRGLLTNSITSALFLFAVKELDFFSKGLVWFLRYFSSSGNTGVNLNDKESLSKIHLMSRLMNLLYIVQQCS